MSNGDGPHREGTMKYTEAQNVVKTLAVGMKPRFHEAMTALVDGQITIKQADTLKGIRGRAKVAGFANLIAALDTLNRTAELVRADEE